MKEVQLQIPDEVATSLRRAISDAGGNEVYFLGRVDWDGEGIIARLGEVETFCRGDASSVPAIISGAEDWDLAIHNHPSGGLDPSEADLSIAAELGNKSVGFAIINNDATDHYLVVKPFRLPEARQVDVDYVRWLFGVEGPFAKQLDGFEYREGQVEMAAEVASALNENRVVACEAGTGVGKSFAYLVPSILWALDNRERVIVSTGTINLQEQLVSKDLPFLEKVLPRDFGFALMKGRGNYGCKRKINELGEEFDLFPEAPDDQEMLRDLVAWAGTTRGGSRSDLMWSPPPRVWEKVMSETDKSLKAECSYFEECFFYNARRQANRAQIVVVNHHLFFADLAVRRQSGNYQHDVILPGYSRVIFDEAHRLEDVASEHLGTRFSRLGVLQRLSRMRSPDGRRGTLAVVARKLRSHNDPVAAERITAEYGVEIGEVTGIIDDLFEELEELVASEREDGQLRGIVGDGDRPVKLRYRPQDSLERFWAEIVDILVRLRSCLERVARANDRAYERVKSSRVRDEPRRSMELEIEAFGNRLQSFIVAVERFCDLDDDKQVRWLDTNERGGGGVGAGAAIGFATAPISVAEDLESSLFKPIKSIVMTSATLSVAGAPDYLGERLGFSALPQERFSFHNHVSPFEFDRQVLLAIPTDIPDPNEPSFEERLPDLLLRLVSASKGRSFVLFTSYSLLRRMYERLEGALSAQGLRPLAQGEAQRSDLLRRFIDSRAGVLFGTDSFWEGVDVKGEALEQVIITRLPFRVPSEPLQEARLEAIAARGENPFAKFTVPQAVLRFKQGFGRLIRSKTDRGVVSVLDRRVLTKPYGKTFLQSLPSTQWCATAFDKVLARVEKFFDGSVPTERDS